MVRYAAPPDAEVGFMIHVSDIAPAVTVVPTSYKDTVTTKGGLLRVKRIGGGLTAKSDEPRISVWGFTLLDTNKPRSSHKLLAQVTSRVLALGEAAPVITIPENLGGEADGSSVVRFDGGDVESGPVQIPWADEDLVLVECIYRLSIRR